MNRLSSSHASTSEVTLEPLWESRWGRIIGTDGEGRPVVDFEGSPVGPRVARKAVRLDAEGLRAAVEARQPVELRFEEGDPRQPIIMALLPAAPREAHSEALRTALAEAAESHARVIQGQDGLMLRCGEAAITLLRNGKVSLKGTSVETTAEGTLRVKGRSVQVGAPDTGDAARPGEALPLPAPGPRPREAAADIQVLQGGESLVLRCGKARLTLLRSGRILIQGTYVETHAEGVNRLLGGTVEIN